ncbi:MAG: alpha/beta hydrolase [Planctomycetes bacterium]|nr:alpha/beta hydrolase [Planctomycetota bacterium]
MFLHANGLRMNVVTAGADDPVLFIHGFPLSNAMWSPVVRRLAARWLCVAPDLRGHGDSEASPAASIADYADDLAAILDQIAPGRPAVVVGLSMGGIIALEFFRKHRSKLRALGLIDTRANPESPEGVARREQMAQAALTAGSRALADVMIGSVLSPRADSAVRSGVYETMCRTSPIGVAAAARALATRPDSFPTLPLIDVPTLVVVGEEDAITPVETLRDIHEKIPNSRFEIIPGAGHVPPLETPERFGTIMESFLAELPSCP